MDVRSLAKAIVPLLFGIIAGILSYAVTLDVRARDPFGIIILVFLIYAQKFVLPKFSEIEAKDWAGIAFLTFAAWYITWVFLLNPIS